MRRRWREESGEATTEMVLIVPFLLLLLLVVVQFGLWYHAQHVVQAAAQEGTRAARVEGATADDGSRRAELFLARSGGAVVDRSEEHTSELQSLMRVSYADFC